MITSIQIDHKVGTTILLEAMQVLTFCLMIQSLHTAVVGQVAGKGGRWTCASS